MVYLHVLSHVKCDALHLKWYKIPITLYNNWCSPHYLVFGYLYSTIIRKWTSSSRSEVIWLFIFLNQHLNLNLKIRISFKRENRNEKYNVNQSVKILIIIWCNQNLRFKMQPATGKSGLPKETENVELDCTSQQATVIGKHI